MLSFTLVEAQRREVEEREGGGGGGTPTKEAKASLLMEKVKVLFMPVALVQILTASAFILQSVLIWTLCEYVNVVTYIRYRMSKTITLMQKSLCL